LTLKLNLLHLRLINIEGIYNSMNKLYKKAFIDACTKHKGIQKSQNDLFSNIKEAIDIATTDEVSGDALESRIKASVIESCVNSEDSSSIISEFSGTLSYALKSNKLKEISSGVQSLIDQPLWTSSIFNGRLEIYDNSTRIPDTSDITNPYSYYGTTKTTYVSATLIYTARYLGVSEDFDFTQSTIAQYYDLPTGLELTMDLNLEPTKGYLIPHSGYSFGGSRPNSKALIYSSTATLNLAQDCSSWIEELSSIGKVLSTVDLLYFSRYKKDPSLYPEWYAETGDALDNNFDVVDLSREQPKIGDIMWYRNFKNPEDVATAFGTSGHTGFLSNEFDPSAFNLLSCARSHEDGLDGYSISPFTFRLPNHDFGFLRPKKSLEDAITFPLELDVVGSSTYDTSGELFDGILGTLPKGI
jgi:hypothetical protein